MNQLVVGLVVGLLVGFVAGLLIARAGGRAARARTQGESDRRIRAAAEAVARGGLPEGGAAGSAELELRRALETGWAPREQEHQRALREAISRVGGFLRGAVREPLEGAGPNADAGELRERIARALGGLEDLEFFLKEPGSEAEKHDLGSLAQQVTREFAADQRIGVRMRLAEQPVRVRVNGPAFMDALYLVLHNAGRFGGGGTVDVTIVEQDGRGALLVRDRGTGFSEEAFKRAFDPFYSTAPDGLGLGLSHARKVVEGMGGRIELSNPPDGGAEVEISFPLA
jgi:signal transduction histidine kinase